MHGCLVGIVYCLLKEEGLFIGHADCKLSKLAIFIFSQGASIAGVYRYRVSIFAFS